MAMEKLNGWLSGLLQEKGMDIYRSKVGTCLICTGIATIYELNTMLLLTREFWQSRAVITSTFSKGSI